MCLGGAAHGKQPAGIAFLEDGVSAVPLGRGHLPFQRGAVPHHRGYTEFGKLLCLTDRGMDVQDRAGIFVYDVADGVQLKFRLADLLGGNHHDMPHFGISKSVHRATEIRGALCPPRSRLS